MSIVAKNLAKILARVKDAANLHKAKIPVRLCAVSKTKPLVDLQAAYDVGQRHFGENYVQELVSKAPDMPADVLWHFIVETIDKTSLAKALDKACKKVGRPTKLNVLVQVNTSGEESKSGAADLETALEIVQYINDECSALQFKGLMTIGALGGDPEPCFQKLVNIRNKILEEELYDLDTYGPLEMSMGMSGDFPLAIKMGSSNVRVGSSIFGVRNYAKAT